MQAQRSARRRRKQRNPILTAAGVAIAAYGTYRLAKFAWETWHTTGSNNNVDTAAEEEEEMILFENSINASEDLKRVRIQRCRVEANRAVMEFLPSLKACIDGLECVDVTECIRELKSIRRGKKNGDESAVHDNHAKRESELWELIKVRSLTKYVVGCYSYTILFLLMNVQVHLLGSKRIQNEVLQQSKDDENSTIATLQESEDSITNTHFTVLKKTYDHFFQNGIPSLAETISKVLSKHLIGWDMRSPNGIRQEIFRNMIKEVRQVLETEPQSNQSSPLLEYIIQDESQVDPDETVVVQHVLDETWDIVESPPFIGALNECLDVTFHLSQNKLTIFEATSSSFSLAQVVAQLKQTLASMLSDESQKNYLDKLVLIPKVKQLGISSFDG